jgi:hypothetical protein
VSILSELSASLKHDAPVRSVLVGAHWTAVCSRGCGLASTLLDDRPHGEAQVRMAGNLTGMSALQISELARSEGLLEASIGVAALNSLLEVDPAAGAAINAVDVLIERGAGKKIALVGHFPFIPSLRGAAGELWVLEQHPGTGEHPAEAASDLIPQADVVAITGTTLINHTLEGLLALCRPEALVMLLGPSTPLSPILFDHGVSILSGVRVVDETAARRTIAEGATFRQVQGVALLTLSRPGWH